MACALHTKHNNYTAWAIIVNSRVSPCKKVRSSTACRINRETLTFNLPQQTYSQTITQYGSTGIAMVFVFLPCIGNSVFAQANTTSIMSLYCKACEESTVPNI